MTETPAVHEFREAYTRFLIGDAAPLVGLLAEGVTYHLPGRHLGGGTLHGREALLRRLSAAAQWCDLIRVELRATATADAFVVTIERMLARHRTRVLDQEVCAVWRFIETRCVELRSTFADQAACDAFWEGFHPPGA